MKTSYNISVKSYCKGRQIVNSIPKTRESMCQLHFSIACSSLTNNHALKIDKKNLFYYYISFKVSIQILFLPILLNSNYFQKEFLSAIFYGNISTCIVTINACFRSFQYTVLKLNSPKLKTKQLWFMKPCSFCKMAPV